MTDFDDPAAKFEDLPVGSLPDQETMRQGAFSRHLRRTAIHEARYRGKKIAAKYNGTCEVCGHDVAVGDSIWWSKGNPPVHEQCVDMTGVEPYVETVSERTRRELDAQEAAEAYADKVLHQHEVEDFYRRGIA